jgi:CHAD domain-containing protein
MALNAALLQKPFRKLRKALKHFPKLPSPDEVHRLRTQTRRLEAILRALMLDRKRHDRDLLEALTPVRKAAGEVRDMDVLVGFASSLATDPEDECLVQLLEHLGDRRVKAAKALHRTIAVRKQEARRLLKQSSKSIEREIGSPRTNISHPSRAATDAIAVSLQLATELGAWPKLHSDNIHPFRLKVKELRYILQLAKDSGSAFVEILGKVKDSIGEWHDWNELASIADSAIGQAAACNLTKRIQDRADQEFERALMITSGMRKQHFGDAHRGHVKRSPSFRLKGSVLTATSLLAG